MQVFGSSTDQPVETMNGFVADANSKGIDSSKVFAAFTPDQVPVISTLANEFAVFDAWYASVPGPTMPNRYFFHSATTHGFCDDDILTILAGVPQATLYDQFNAANVSWGVYFEEVPDTLVFQSMRSLENLARHHWFSEFQHHLDTQQLPQFSFIAPTWLTLFNLTASDQHPSHDVTEGERLMKTVYEALRASSYWNDTLFIITYDEHGGFYDHVPPPMVGVPNPDGINCTTGDIFSFNRLGVRIPTIMVSPWINANTVVSEPPAAQKPTPTSQYDTTSVAATMKKLFGTQKFLTKRDAWAATFEHVWSQRTSPRTDCPATLPTPPPSVSQRARRLSVQTGRPVDGSGPLSGLQQTMVSIAASLEGTYFRGDGMTEAEASLWIREKVNTFLGRSARDQPTHPLYTGRPLGQ